MLQDQLNQMGRVGQVGRVGQGEPSVADRRWAAVLDRSGTDFVYAVTSTGVYCRPRCPSRRPRRDRVRFFERPADAERAGFRACRRCRPDDDAAAGVMAEAVSRACAYLEAHADERVTLTTLGRLAGVTPTHFQRVFKRAVGLSPREYHAACRADRFREELRAGRDVTTALYEAGYGSPSRIYETPPTGHGMAPAAYRRGGEGTTIAFTTLRTPLGWLLVASTEKGVCAVRLGDSKQALEAELRDEFPAARLSESDAVPQAWIAEIVDRLSGSHGTADVPLDVRGTSFQWRVWQALQKIPTGQTRSYGDIARAIGKPAAVRAVARACAANPVGVVIPCHRVIARNGALGGYRWGVARKARLLKSERQASGLIPKPAKGFRS